jgi:uncharacterized repeat protein (TIGR03837 family)
MTARWDIFCKVVDNFGDAGVAWRLARELADEHSLAARLWIDDPRSLARMAPGIDASADAQCHAGVEIRRWREAFADPFPADADVVIEAFGCGLPESYARSMAQRVPAPVWFVLEYLSAEAWIDGGHGLPSPHPCLPLTRRFWFPGFTPASGGLLRERGLIEARDAFQRDVRGRADFWSSLSVPVPAGVECRVSLFCYRDPALPALLDAWSNGDEAVGCIVPEGVAAGALDAWTGGNVPHAGRPVSRGRLTLHAIPFLSQQAYDRLLWACDINFVRGEDSFVRAQWASRPFVWHIYPQADEAHQEKLDAFVDRYTAALDPPAATAVRRLFRAWNRPADAEVIDDAWRTFAGARPVLERHAAAWSRQMAELPELASGLVKAATDLV